MRTIDFSHVLFNALQYSGNDVSNITDETFGQFRDFCSSRMREAWETFEWQDVCRISEFTSTQSAGIKFFTPAANADEILAVFDRNPLATTRATSQTYTIYYDGTEKIVVSIDSGFYVYRTKCPELTGNLYKSTVVYEPGSQVYWDTGAGLIPEDATPRERYVPKEGKPCKGNFYVCTSQALEGQNPSTHPEKWSKLEIPYVFGTYMSWGSTANWLVSEGMVQEAAVIEAKAREVLENEYDKATRQQGQFNRLTMIRTY